jgi:hypothetical protein
MDGWRRTHALAMLCSSMAIMEACDPASTAQGFRIFR